MSKMMELEIDDFSEAEIFSKEVEPEVAAEAGTQEVNTRTGAAIHFDIETGPRPWPEIEQFFEPPEPPGEFDPKSIKLGNLKDPAKIAEKMAAAKSAHAAEVAGHGAAVEQARREFVSGAALSPITGRVLAIGTARDGETTIIGDGKRTEADLLETFWQLYRRSAESKGTLVGFNIFGFDLPFLIRRSWMLDVDVPDDVIRNRRWSPVFVDLMDVWGCGAYKAMVSLDTVARFFGVGGKPNDVDGGMFASLWENPDTHQQAVEYLKNDMAMTMAVARKMGVC
jgi:hypothetical protein